MDWTFRLLGAAAAFLLLLGISVAVATGPIAAGSPNQPSAPSAASTTPFPQPVPTSAEVPAPLPLLTTGATAGVPAFVPVEERPVAVFLGDSITRGATDPSFGVADEYSWFYGLIDDSVGAVRWGGTVAEIGMTTSWMADQAYDALALSPDILIVHGGTNDISGEIDMPYLISNFQRIKDAADAYGIPLAVCTVPPRDDPAADARAIVPSTTRSGCGPRGRASSFSTPRRPFAIRPVDGNTATRPTGFIPPPRRACSCRRLPRRRYAVYPRGYSPGTHFHNDYATGGLELASKHGAVYVVPAGSEIRFDATHIGDGDVLDVGICASRSCTRPARPQPHVLRRQRR